MLIYKALLAHGFANFKLEILEYCEPSKLIERANKFICLLQIHLWFGGPPPLPPPTYSIFHIPYVMLCNWGDPKPMGAQQSWAGPIGTILY